MSESMVILNHLGNGDAFIANAILRHYAKDKTIVYPCWHNNVATLSQMFSDANIFFHPVEKEQEAIDLANKSEGSLKLGYYNQPFDATKFDQEFYRQAGMDFEKRWSEFKIPKPIKAGGGAGGGFSFIHDDSERGFIIDDSKFVNNSFRIPNKSPLYRILWWLTYAQEIHVINSSMLILADSIETPNAKRLVLHHYARKTIYPRLKKSWEVI